MQQDFNINEIKLVIGLGNPSDKYKNTYHNVGLDFIDFIKQKTSAKILKSENFMNNSGQFVKKSLDYYNTSPENILVVHDDSDLTLGQYKLSFARGSAGHKGIKSVINHLSTKEFWRLRIGIRPGEFKGKAEKFVLKKISGSDQETLGKVFREITEDIL